MDVLGTTILIIGVIFLIGLLTELVADKLRIPKVTLLLFFGFLAGPAVFHIISPDVTKEWFPAITDVALAMIGFLLGSKITFSSLKNIGGFILGISVVMVLLTSSCVFVGLLIAGEPMPLALLLAGLSAATAPATTMAVIIETKAEGLFTRILTSIVAIDAAWTLVLFSFCLVAAHFLLDQTTDSLHLILQGLWQVGGAIALGIGLGIPMAFITGRIQRGEPTLLEAMGIVFIGCGLALMLNVSYILALMVMGCTVANVAGHYKRAFHAIEKIEWPFMALFFILGGATLKVDTLWVAGVAGIFYIVFRSLGRIIGGYIGGLLMSTNKIVRRWLGVALLPQAGLAIGMALVAIHNYPQYADHILPIVLASTIIFEIIGPAFTKLALQKAGND
jgi:Kef-type K+ transport system membrane component KefB